MIQEQFTPGPWEAVRDEKNERWQIQETDNNGLVLVQHTFDGEEAEANANLIAAAPDMYEALKNVRNSLVNYANNGDLTKYQASKIYEIIMANGNAINNALAKTNPQVKQ